MLVAFSVSPVGVGEDVGEIVAEAVRVVRESGLPNQTDAMFTTIEGDWDEVMTVVKAAVDAVAARAPRVSLVLKADLRQGVTGAMTAKVETIERYLSSLRRRRGRADGVTRRYSATGTRSMRATRPASSSRSAGRIVRSWRT
jgi:uncharacterized protein (TIGR00106 family)